MKKLSLVFVLSALIALAGNLSPAVAQQGYHLTILHTSENHGHWEPSLFNNVSQGGIARRATLVKQLRGQIPNLLLLDSGDIAQGTLYFVQYKGVEARDLYNMLGYDAVTLGNHEFDLGPAVLASNFLSGAQFSTVLANIDVSREPALIGKVPPSVIKTVGGERIGIFGLVHEEVPILASPGPNVRFMNPVETARSTVASLEAQGVNKIIVLSHMGFQADMDLAKQVNGIDVIISGHTETLLGEAGKLDASLGAPVGPYPSIAATPNGGKTLVVHAFIWGRVLGRLDLLFDERGVVQNWAGEPIFVGAGIAEDAAVAAKLKDLDAPLQVLKRQIIGRTSVDLIGDRPVVRNRESNLGNLIADAMLWATRADNTQIAFVNGGGIRASIRAGDVSFGQVLDTLPFGNRIVQMDVTGADLMAALENAVSRLSPDLGESAGRFLQVAGLRFTADLSRPANSRMTQVTVGNAALNPAATYRIAINDFMAGGGDGFTSFTRGRNVRGGDLPLDLVLSDYIKANSPVSPAVEGRIGFTGSLTPTAAPVAEAPATIIMPSLMPVAGDATPWSAGAPPAGAAMLGFLLLAAGLALKRTRRAGACPPSHGRGTRNDGPQGPALRLPFTLRRRR